MYAIRATSAFDGESFLDDGATVFIEDVRIVGVESSAYPVPDDCPVSSHVGTVLPGLIDMHTHLVTDSGVMALGRVAGYADDEIDAVITQALVDQLAAGVTTVRDLGDRDFCVVARRDRQAGLPVDVPEPTIVAAGPPITSPGGHCHFLGGEVSGTDEIERAIAERVDRGVDIVKVMASGGMNTPGSDVLQTQFSTDGLRLIVDRAHAAGLPVTAHAHGTPSVEQAIAVGVDGIEHCSCVTERSFGEASDETVAALAASRIAVCPTLGIDPYATEPPPPIKAALERMGLTIEQAKRERWQFVGRLHQAGVRLVSGVDSGIAPPKRHGMLPQAVCELIQCGLSAAQALASATSQAADACSLGGRKGRLAAGFDADLLVADGELESDLTALRRPRAVVLRGEPISF